MEERKREERISERRREAREMRERAEALLGRIYAEMERRAWGPKKRHEEVIEARRARNG